MKFKIFFLLFLLFILCYVILSILNPDTVKFYYWAGHMMEMSVASFVVLSFVLGVIVSIIVSFLYDVKITISSWIVGRKGRKTEEFKEFLEKAKSYDLRGDREK